MHVLDVNIIRKIGVKCLIFADKVFKVLRIIENIYDFILVCLYSNLRKYIWIGTKLIEIINFFYIMLPIKNGVCSIYSPFTGALKSIHYDLYAFCDNL